jgi:hypothetical protein
MDKRAHLSAQLKIKKIKRKKKKEKEKKKKELGVVFLAGHTAPPAPATPAGRPALLAVRWARSRSGCRRHLLPLRQDELRRGRAIPTRTGGELW